MWLCVVLLGIGLLALSQSARARGLRQPASLEPRTVTLDAAALARGANQRTRVTPDGVAPDGAGGVYTTAPQQVAQFSDVLVSWRATVPVSAGLHVFVRAADDGATWSKWAEVEATSDMFDERDPLDMRWGSPVFAGLASWWQVRVEFEPAPDGGLPVLHEIRVDSVDVGELPAQPVAAAATQGISKPPVVSRTAWGSGDGQGSRATPAYYPVNHMVVHHTVDPNSLTSSEGWWGDRVRAIWSFHTFSRGWGDIGYNYLVAPTGQIFEGRAGGDNAVGFHDTGNYGSMGVAMIGTYDSVAPTSSAQNSLVDILAWKASQRSIDPLGSSYYYGCDISRYCGNAGAVTPNIAGHRQVANNPVGYTSCPGDDLLGILPGIRSRVQSRLSGSTDNGDLTIDDLESSFTRSAAEWFEAGCGDGGHIFYTYTTDNAAESSNSAIWRKENLPAGDYRVYVHIPQNCGWLNATQGARYTIWQNGAKIGEKTVSQDTSTEWLEITSGPLAHNGMPAEVHLTDLTGEPLSSGRKVIFDTVRWVKDVPQASITLEQVRYDRTVVAGGELLKVIFRVRNTGNVTVSTQAPDAGDPANDRSGYTYDEGECFAGNGSNAYPAFPKESGRFRVMLGGDGLGTDCSMITPYPWRWSIGGDLAPGEVREVAGYVRFRNLSPSSRQVTLKAGLINEYVAYVAENQAVQTITITPENDAPQSVAYAGWAPQATAYDLAGLPDDFLARTANPLSIPEGAVLGSFAWDGGRLDWGEGGPFNHSDFFLVRQARTFVAPADGTYRFRITSDDGAWLWIDGSLVAEAHGLHAERETIGERWLTAGEHVLGFKYFERTAQAVMSYDWQPPGASAFSSIPVVVAGGAVRSGNYFAPNAQMTIGADDLGGAGVTGIRWRLNGSAWEQESGPRLSLVLGGGAYTLEYAAVDAAGNLEGVRSLQFSIDGSTPTSLVSAASVEPTGMIRLSLTSADAGSGVQNVEISLRDQAEGVWRPWISTTQPSVGFFGTPGHTYEFRSRAIDAVGNREFIHADADASATTPIDATFQRLSLPVVMR
jgi:hypothetical protein